MNPRVVVVDDEKAMRESIKQWLDLADCHVSNFADGRIALNEVTSDFNGVIVTDLKMPNIDGHGILQAVMQIDTDIPVVLITGHGDVNSAVQAMQQGAYDFIEKPFEPERLLSTITRAAEKRDLVIQKRDLVIQNRQLRDQASKSRKIEERLIGESAAMRKIRNDITRFSAVDVNILLLGETGTGKEISARCLHDFSDRSEKSFRAIDCGAIPDDRLAKELFGSDTDTPFAGPFELADGGSLLLDEVTNMPLQQQAALLRVLEQREIQRVGSSESRPVDVRLISAADVSLRESVDNNRFRKDLFFRLNTLEITLPPLRERDDDSVILFDYFMRKACQLYATDLPVLASPDVTALRSHDWPGNVRELKNLAERYVLYQNVPVSELIAPDNTLANRPSLSQQTQAFEKSIIQFALHQCNGNISEAAEFLRVPRRTLSDKLARHEL
ncbi:MAG: sigma-54-dependent transcriptional regulator [Granulosicoccus sp.]